MITNYFNPRPPWGGRRRGNVRYINGGHFNPRPPWGGRLNGEFLSFTANRFQSTPSVGRATWVGMDFGYTNDPFQSTPSVGRATGLSVPAFELLAFQSTPSVGRATNAMLICPLHILISIHALRGEGDAFRHCRLQKYLCRFQSTPSVGRATFFDRYCKIVDNNFNPRPPWGGRLEIMVALIHGLMISIHALRGEGDKKPN